MLSRERCKEVLTRIRKEATDSNPLSVANNIQGLNDFSSENWLKDVLGISAASFGAAGAIRGAGGLYNHLFGQTFADRKLRSGPARLALPYPVKPQDAPAPVEEEEKKADSDFGDQIGKWWDQGTAALGKFKDQALAAMKPDEVGVNRATGQENLPTPKAPLNPYYADRALYPISMIAAGAGAGYLGWQGMDKLLRDQQQRRDEEELGRARGKFNEALLGQYQKPVAVRSKLGADLDQLFDQVQAASRVREKQADIGGAIGSAVDWLGNAAESVGEAAQHIPKAYGIYAAASGIPAAVWVYDRAKKRNQAELIEAALRKRQADQARRSPAPVFAVPEPVEHIPSLGKREEQQLLAA